MTHIKVKGFKIFRDKKPPFAERCYHRATGHKIDLEKVPIGSAAFFAECEKIRAIAEGMKARAPKAGTLGGIIARLCCTNRLTAGLPLSPDRPIP